MRSYITSFHPKTSVLHVILRSKATKNPIGPRLAEILRGACPEPVEGLRMTLASLRMETSYVTSNKLRSHFLLSTVAYYSLLPSSNPH